MKVLFYFASHFNAEMIGPQLEKVQQHIIAGNDVTILYCNKELSSCNINPNHSNITCSICKSNFSNGIKSINGSFRLISLNDVLPFTSIDPKFEFMDMSSIDAFKNSYYKGFDIGMATFSSLASKLRNPTPDFKQHEVLTKSYWKSAVWVYELICKELDSNSYEVVYVFNGRVATLRACLRACESKQVNCHILETGQNSSLYSEYINALPHDIKNVVQLIENNWNNASESKFEIAQEYYDKRSKGKDLLNGHFIENQKSGLLPDNWDPSKENIAIYVSSEDEFVAVGKEWDNPIFKTQLDGIKFISQNFIKDTQKHFYIRIHPNLNGILNDSTKSMYELKASNLTLIEADSPISTYALMFSVSKVITFGSSTSIEAAAQNIPSILVGQNFYKTLGSTYNPETKDELLELISRVNLPAKENLGALKFGFFLFTFGQKYEHYSYKSKFEGTMNGKVVRPNLILYLLRKIGRAIRSRQTKKSKKRNQFYLNSLMK